MDRRIRVLALALVVCFGLLFLQLNNWQIRQSNALSNDPHDIRKTSTYFVPRGDIVASDGTPLAESTPTNDEDAQQRSYPQGPLFADVTGYFDVAFSSDSGIEEEYDHYLQVHQSASGTPSQILTQHSGTDTVVLTVDPRLQQVAANALGTLIGAVVAVVPSTGAVLALYGNPTFDPNKLAVHSQSQVLKYYNSLNPNSGASPLVNFPTQQTTAPGSTFKVITTAAALDHDLPVTSTVWPVQSSIPLKETNLRLRNFNGEACGGDLAKVLAASCDTAYAQIGVAVGARSLADEATAFGFNQIAPLDLPAGEVSPACFPPVDRPATVPGCAQASPIGAANIPGVAYSAIGQEDVSESALQDALVAAAFGNQGVIMTPHLLSHVVDDEGNIVTSYKNHPWLQATSAATADQVRLLMTGVTGPGGTAAGLFPSNLDVAAKTGTAETGLTNCSSTWLIATAPAGPNDTPKIAVSAVVPQQPGIGCSETGAEVAGKVVAKVIDAYLGSGQ